MPMPLIFADTLWRRTLQRDSLEPIDYYVGGCGNETIAIINAYGQSLAFWEHLVARLAKRYRVLLWQPRGTRSQDGGTTCAYPIDAHVLDMRCLFEVERIARAHLLGWCSGPKTALAYYAADRKSVASMIFLTGCFIQSPAYKPLYTRYETAMNDLCRLIDQRPQAAEQLGAMFRSVLFNQRQRAKHVQAQGQTPSADDKSAESVIASLVRAPFQAPESIVDYSRQLLAFWDYDISFILPQVAVPALFIGGGADDITHPRLSREMACRVPGAIYAEVRDGSHYLHYEQPSLLSELITCFTQHSDLSAPLHEAISIERFSNNMGNIPLSDIGDRNDDGSDAGSAESRFPVHPGRYPTTAS